MKTNYAEWLRSAWQVAQPWVQRNVTFGLLLAVVTEAPRWVFAFVGAHEPVWAGIAVAVLLSFAAAQGWDEYFRGRDPLLLCMNIAQVASAMIIITPVIFAMATGEGHNVQLKDILPKVMLWVWSGTLVVTTFLPLVVVAYVEVQRHERKSMHDPAQPKPKRVAQPTAQPSLQPAIVVDATPVEDVQPAEESQPDPKEVAKQLKSEGLSNAQIAAQLSVNPSTVGRWLNGAAKVAA